MNKKALEDVERGHINTPENYEIDVNFFKDNNRYMDYLKHVHKFDGYGEIVFPHCPCDSRKNGHIILILNSLGLKLRACSREGEPESQVVEFAYESLVNISVDNDEMAFIVEVSIKNKPNKVIKFYTGFVRFLFIYFLKFQNHSIQ